MAFFPSALTPSFDRGERLRLGLFYGAIALIHVVGWGLLLPIAQQYPALLGLGGLAYSFGMRHAFDADHISAIDNTTRKLLQDRKRPVGVGFFFSLGHSTVVFLIALLLGFAVKSVVDSVVADNGQLRALGGIVGTGVSGLFLLLIGVLNLIILLGFMGFFEAVLTLPGIAGVILTVGMGVDSNVLIFERLKEEVRGGKWAIIVTELPYQVNKAKLIERIAELVREKTIEGIAASSSVARTGRSSTRGTRLVPACTGRRTTS